jgi:hypothetical protein
MKSVFVAIGASGKVYMAPTKEAAQAQLKAAGDVGRGTWVEGSNASEARANEEKGLSLAQITETIGLRRVPESVLSMSTAEAFARLAPVFEGLYDARKRGPQAPTIFRTPSAFIDGLLAPNAKQSKSTNDAASAMSYSGPTTFVGLNLLPAGKLLSDFPRWMREADEGKAPHWANMPFLRDLESGKFGIPKVGNLRAWKVKGFCYGSSEACRSSCLVFTGSNESEPYNDVRKAALSAALLYDVDAFVRLLFEAAQKTARKTKGLLMVRLNLLSDVPWEYIAPWFFERAPRNVMFYDYTKVFQRLGRQPENYDLTFSFSGQNENQCERALAAGHRVAAALLMYRPVMKKGRGKETITTYEPMGSRTAEAVKPPPFWDIWGGVWPTTDADVNDARPFDPRYSPFIAKNAERFGLTPPERPENSKPSIGVLRWKTPKGSKVKPEESKFAVKYRRDVKIEDSGVSFITKAQYDDATGYLLVPVTPRQEGVDVAGP